MQQERSRMMGTMPMGKLIMKVSVPIMISMTVQALYNVVDSIFVAQHSAAEFTAVSLANPLQMLMISVSTGLAVGINSLVSRRLGEKRPEEARLAAHNGIMLEIIGFLLFLLFGLFLARPAMNLLYAGAGEEILTYGGDYLQIVTIYSLGLFVSVVMERFMQVTGNTVLSMFTQIFGAIVNVILDPIMIFGYLGCPEMGVRGAAIATVIGQCSSMTLGLILNQVKNKELRISRKYFRPDGRMMGEILAVGIPSVIMSSISSVMAVLLNNILMIYGTVAVNVLGAYIKLNSFVFMPVFGLSNGLVPIIGYNFGARDKKRLYSSIRIGLLVAEIILCVGMVLFLTIPQVFLKLFESEDSGEAFMEIGCTALRIIGITFPFAAAGITFSTVFQAVGKGVNSMVMSLCRQLVVLLPVAWLFSKLSPNSPDLVWWCFLVSEAVALVISVFMLANVQKKIFAHLGEEKTAGEIQKKSSEKERIH